MTAEDEYLYGLEARLAAVSRDFDTLLSKLITDAGPGSEPYRWRFRCPDRNGYFGHCGFPTRTEAVAAFRREWGLDPAEEDAHA